MIINNRNLSRTIFRAVKILNTINEGNTSITTISDLLDLDKATVYRILKSLEKASLVTQSFKNRNYYLGPLLIKLTSNPLVGHHMLINCAIDEMARLRDKYNETSCLQVLTGMSGTYVEVVESRHSIRHSIGIGNSLPLNIGSGGKVLLSQLTAKDLEIFFKCAKLINMGEYGITNEEELRGKINKIGETGYMISFAEVSRGGVGIAVPIYEYVCPASLSILCPSERCDDAKIAEMIKDLKESARLISSRLVELNDSVP